MKFIAKRIFTWLFVLMVIFGVSNAVQDDDVTIQLRADTMYMVYYSAETGVDSVDGFNVDILLVFNYTTFTCGDLEYVLFGEPHLYEGKNLFSMHATDSFDNICKLWFIFENKTLFKVGIEYSNYSILFERRLIKT
jgi:hypothetical protein